MNSADFLEALASGQIDVAPSEKYHDFASELNGAEALPGYEARLRVGHRVFVCRRMTSADAIAALHRVVVGQPPADEIRSAFVAAEVTREAA
jgi:hypothetical protein